MTLSNDNFAENNLWTLHTMFGQPIVLLMLFFSNFAEVRHFRSSSFHRSAPAVAPDDIYPRFRPTTLPVSGC